MMRVLSTVIAAFSLIALAACNQSEPTPDVSAAPQAPTLQQLASTPTPVAPPAAPASPANAQPQDTSDFPTVPDGALYTIFCISIDTPTHVPDADHLKEQLVEKTHSHDWYVIHSEGASSLYYGFYKTFDDDNQPAEKQRAQQDRQTIAALKDNSGDFPFASCGFQPLNSPDPTAPPEWDLRNANGFWTVQIAAYVGSPQRKQFAVDAVRQARAMGIEAYYYHGPSISSVCIGAWPRQAVKEQDSADARVDEPAKHIMVLPEPLTKGHRTDNIVGPDGEKVKVVVPRVEPIDPTLIQTMQQYPTNDVNGETRYHTVQSPQGPQKRPDPSFLVIIPHKGDNSDSGTDAASGAPTVPGLGDNAAGGSGGAAGQTDPNAAQQPAPSPNPFQPGAPSVGNGG